MGEDHCGQGTPGMVSVGNTREGTPGTGTPLRGVGILSQAHKGTDPSWNYIFNFLSRTPNKNVWAQLQAWL